MFSSIYLLGWVPNKLVSKLFFLVYCLILFGIGGRSMDMGENVLIDGCSEISDGKERRNSIDLGANA